MLRRAVFISGMSVSLAVSMTAIADTTSDEAGTEYQRLTAPRVMADDLVPDCPLDGAPSCLKVFVDRADARLNLLYQGLLQQLNADPGVKQALITSERRWIAFRDANCRVPSAYYRGAMHDYKVQDCLLDLTKRRAEELRKFAWTDQILTGLNLGK